MKFVSIANVDQFKDNENYIALMGGEADNGLAERGTGIENTEPYLEPGLSEMGFVRVKSNQARLENQRGARYGWITGFSELLYTKLRRCIDLCTHPA
jgi:hypothetical protein